MVYDSVQKERSTLDNGKTHKIIKNTRFIDTENRLVVIRGERGCGVAKKGDGGQLCGDGWQLDLR